MSDGSAKSERAFGVGEGCDEATAARERSRKRAKVEARNDGECAERADEELVEVVASDVLDDAAAALGESNWRSGESMPEAIVPPMVLREYQGTRSGRN